MNVSTRCRTCLLESDELKTMFSVWDDSINLWNMYDYIMNVGENDNTVLVICIKCEESLKSAYTFKLMCAETERTLSELSKREKSTTLKIDNEETDGANFEDSCMSDMLGSDINEVYQICANDQDDQNHLFESNINQIETIDETIESVASQLIECKVRKCKVCDIQFENIKSYQVHYRKVHSHSVSKVLCSYCGKLVSKHSIDKHYSSHSSVKIRNHLCTVCGSSFTLVENLKKHLRIHSNDKR